MTDITDRLDALTETLSAKSYAHLDAVAPWMASTEIKRLRGALVQYQRAVVRLPFLGKVS